MVPGLTFLKIGVVYTEVSGWVDMGYARGDDIATLKRQLVDGERSGKDDYTVTYRQEMRIARFGTSFGVGKFARWDIKRGASNDDVNRIMLAMMMPTASKSAKPQSIFLVYRQWF